jgi:hypothetical protein
VVPLLCGFVPRESYVLVLLAGPEKRVVLSLRWDLGSPLDLSEEAGAAILNSGADGGLLVVAVGDMDEPPAEWFEVHASLPVPVVDVLVTDGLRYGSLVCHDPLCGCGGTLPDGGWLGPERDEHRAQVNYTPRRVPPTALTRPVAGLVEWRIDTARRLAQAFTGDSTDDELFAEIDAYVELGIAERDTMFKALFGEGLERPHVESVVAYCRGASGSFSTCLAACLCFAQGDGVLFDAMTERIDRAGPGGSFRLLMEAARGTHPSMWTELMTDLAIEATAGCDQAT